MTSVAAWMPEAMRRRPECRATNQTTVHTSYSKTQDIIHTTPHHSQPRRRVVVTSLYDHHDLRSPDVARSVASAGRAV